MEEQRFFSVTKGKVSITAVFFGLRLLLGYLHRWNIAAKLPFVVDMILAAVDFVVSLPMKLVFGSQFLKSLLSPSFFVLLLFVLMIAYWYLFSCVLVYAYELLNRQDAEVIGGKKEEQ